MLYKVCFKNGEIVSAEKLNEEIKEEGAWNRTNNTVSGCQIINASSDEEAKQKTISIMDEILNQILR